MAQNNDDSGGIVPPEVIALKPFPGEEMPLDMPLTVVFNQAMDQSSVEAAWLLSPAVEGAFTWPDDRTLVFTPSQGWDLDGAYTLVITTGAKSAEGSEAAVPMADDYSADLRAVGSLAVSSVIPAEGAEGVAADATITVAFNRPVVPLVYTGDIAGLPDPLTLEPAVEGTGEWLNTSIYQFTPATELQGGTTYTVTVNAGLEAVNGSPLTEAYTYSFKTLVPEILSTYPSQGMQFGLDENIVITFSQEMDKASVENSLTIMDGTTAMDGAFSWSEDGRVVTFDPSERLPIGTTLRVTLDAANVRGAGGAALRQGRDFVFSTTPLPYVSETSPRNGEMNIAPGYRRVTIFFGTPMNTSTFEGRYEVSPAPENIVPVVYGDTSLGLEFEFAENTRYTVTLKAGTEDIYGNPIPEDYTFSFNVGTVQPSFYMQDDRGFVVTGGYRDDTSLIASVTGDPTVDFELYEIQETDLGNVVNYLDDEAARGLMSRSERLREWSENLGQDTVYAQAPVLLNSEEGGALPLGTYMLHATFDRRAFLERLTNQQYGIQQQYVALAVVNTTLTIRRAGDELLVWATDMQTGAPVAEINVDVFGFNSDTPLVSATTDAAGVARMPTPLNRELIISARNSTRYGVWYSSWANSPNTSDLYFYTDRPIYRPGETLYFKGIYRINNDYTYTVGDLAEIKISAQDARGQIVLEETLTVNEFGAFSGEMALAEDVAIGQLYFSAMTPQGDYLGNFSAQIAEFRVPEFQVSVNPAEEEITEGDPVRAVIEATYFSGGAASGATVSWYATVSPSVFNYTGPGDYSFTDRGFIPYAYFDGYYGYGYGYGGRTIASGEGTTDADGKLLIEISDTKFEGTDPQTVTIEATVNDESGQYISGRTSVFVHSAEAYVGVRTEQYFGRAGEPITAEVITVDQDSQPVSGNTVILALIENRWEREPVEGRFGQYTWTEREIEVESVRLVTDEQGRASYAFTPPNAGRYTIRARTLDRLEREHISGVSLWVTGTGRVWWGQPSNRIDLIADKESYVAGDTAQILIPVSLEGTSYVLVTLERSGIKRYEVIEVEGTTLVYELPVVTEYEPGITVNVMVMHGIDEANTTPTYREGSITLDIEPVSKRLDVVITPDQTNAQPGETVTLDIQANTPDGEPAQVELSLALVDEAILSLTNPNSQSPEAHYYGSVSNWVNGSTMLISLIDTRLDEIFKDDEKQAQEVDSIESEEEARGLGGAGFDDAMYSMDGAVMEMSAAPSPTMTAMAAQDQSGGGFDEVTVRENFQQTPLWEAHVVTDENGQAQVSVTLPDNLTIWDLTARGITVDTEVGEVNLDIRSTLPLLVRPATPRFFVVGDEVSLAMVVNNNTDEAQDVRATIIGEGYELVEGESLEQTQSIPANGRARYEWRVTIPDVQAVNLTFVAIGNDGYQDASKPPLADADGNLPVYRYTAPDTVGTGGVLRTDGSRTEGISLPPFTDFDQGQLNISLDPSLAVTTLDALDYLENYPHQCIEQTVSRFLPNIANYRALTLLGVDDPVLAVKLEAQVNFGLERLRSSQNFDGGWGWFVNMESNALVSAYATLGLIEAKEAGFTVEQDMLDRAISFLRGQFINPTEDTETWRLNRQAFYFFVLTRAEDGRYDPSVAELDALFRVRLEMNIDAKAYLLRAYNALASRDLNVSDQIAALTSDLVTAAKLSATGAHWEEDYRDWWNWSSDVRSTSLALSALIESMPESDLLPNAVRWLMVARQGKHWETTQETTWSIIALTDWMVATNELQGNYDYAVILNGDSQAEGSVTPDTVREGRDLSIAVSELLRDELNRVTFVRGEGEGALYYTAHLDLRLDASEVSAIDRGIGVTREYFNEDGEPVTEVNMGDVVTVRLTLNLPETVYYFVLEDPLPAGLEALDTSLLTTTRSIEGPRLTPEKDPYYWWWWWIWDHTEIRDESVNLYADELWPGTYVYSYQAQATTPGKFQAMPSHGYAFYFPEVFGRSDGALFTVNGLDE